MHVSKSIYYLNSTKYISGLTSASMFSSSETLSHSADIFLACSLEVPALACSLLYIDKHTDLPIINGILALHPQRCSLCTYPVMWTGDLCILRDVLWRAVHTQRCPLEVCSGVFWRSVLTQQCPLEVCAYSVVSSEGLCIFSGVLCMEACAYSVVSSGGLCILSGVLWRSVHIQWCPLEVCAYSVVVCVYPAVSFGGLCILSGVFWRSVPTQRCPLEGCAYPLLNPVHTQRCPVEVCAYPALSSGGPIVISSILYGYPHSHIQWISLGLYTSLYTIIILRRYMHKWRDVIESKRSW